MGDTKERILLAALGLFAREGYAAVSMSRIAGELGMGKSALYKHYPGKRAIFDGICARMARQDGQQARKYGVPGEPAEKEAQAYRHTSLAQVKAFTLAQFQYWTQEELPCRFRQLLTLEQYRDEEMARLYRQYLSAGPVEYLRELFAGITGRQEGAGRLALTFYGPVFLLYSLFDGGQAGAQDILEDYLDRFTIEEDHHAISAQ